VNPTKAQLKQAFGFAFDTELADALAISKQAVSQQDDDRPVPDAWCWRAFKARPDIFGDPPEPTAKVITPKPKPPKTGGAKARVPEKEAA